MDFRDEGEPAWSPDGSKLAYTEAEGSDQDIWVIPATGGIPVKITTDPGYDRDPTWSPDGGWIAYEHWGAEGDDIWKIPATGGTPVRLTFSPGEDWSPDWSPDGFWVAFTTDRYPGGGGRDICVIPASGEPPAYRVTNNIHFDYEPTWSPDSSKIAFASSRTGGRDIWGTTVDFLGVQPASLGRVKALFK
jgi:TolB protein